jgi:hypothetical protein
MRKCGDCQLCCKLLPTPEIDKLANVRCRHQKHGVGCAIYDRRPLSCQMWRCQWLAPEEFDTLDLPRPDRVHYVVDMIPDYVTMTWHDGRPPDHLPVVQVWVDPDHRDAHRDPALRRWLERQRMPAIIRYSERDGFVLFPPSCSEDRQWHEQRSGMSEHSHTLEQKAAALGGSLSISLDAGNGAVWSTTLKVGDKQFAVASQAATREEAERALADVARIREQRGEQ